MQNMSKPEAFHKKLTCLKIAENTAPVSKNQGFHTPETAKKATKMVKAVTKIAPITCSKNGCHKTSVLGASWALLGRSWVPLGRSWTALGRFLGPLGCLLGAPWWPLGALGRLLGTLGLFLAAVGLFFGTF